MNLIPLIQICVVFASAATSVSRAIEQNVASLVQIDSQVTVLSKPNVIVAVDDEDPPIMEDHEVEYAAEYSESTDTPVYENIPGLDAQAQILYCHGDNGVKHPGRCKNHSQAQQECREQTGDESAYLCPESELRERIGQHCSLAFTGAGTSNACQVSTGSCQGYFAHAEAGTINCEDIPHVDCNSTWCSVWKGFNAACCQIKVGTTTSHGYTDDQSATDAPTPAPPEVRNREILCGGDRKCLSQANATLACKQWYDDSHLCTKDEMVEFRVSGTCRYLWTSTYDNMGCMVSNGAVDGSCIGVANETFCNESNFVGQWNMFNAACCRDSLSG